MKNCTGCRHAEWRLTKNGQLHPSGDGECLYVWEMPPLPQSMYWMPWQSPLKPAGGHINRGKELTITVATTNASDMKTCTYDNPCIMKRERLTDSKNVDSWVGQWEVKHERR